MRKTVEKFQVDRKWFWGRGWVLNWDQFLEPQITGYQLLHPYLEINELKNVVILHILYFRLSICMFNFVFLNVSSRWCDSMCLKFLVRSWRSHFFSVTGKLYFSLKFKSHKNSKISELVLPCLVIPRKVLLCSRESLIDRITWQGNTHFWGLLLDRKALFS